MVIFRKLNLGNNNQYNISTTKLTKVLTLSLKQGTDMEGDPSTVSWFTAKIVQVCGSGESCPPSCVTIVL